MILAGRDLTVRHAGAAAPALDGVACALAPGELVAVAGPNGAGKSTLLRALLGTVPIERGAVTLLERPLSGWTRREIATLVGVVSQGESPPAALRVEDVVLLGRYARLGPLEAPRPADRAAVADALARTDAAHLRGRRAETLSGGEWQRVRLARALAQSPRALLLDEPTTALDVRHAMELLERLRALADEGMGCLLVTHDLNLVARYADRLLLLGRGRVIADGPPAAVLTRERVSALFDWPVAVTTWCDGSPQLVPLRPNEAGVAPVPPTPLTDRTP